MPARPAAYVKQPIRLGDREWDAEVRGGLVALKGRLKCGLRCGGGRRGRITTFSRASHLRMLKTTATINWRKAKKGLFVTLTFPDGTWPQTKGQRMRALWQWFRQVENLLGKKVSALWRLEWKKRKTGAYKDQYLPHFHLIVFGASYIRKEDIRKFWANALRYEGPLATDVQRLENKRHHAVYIAKYVAKVPDLTALDYVAYSRIDGRHWGYYRRPLLPRYESMYFTDISLANVKTLRDVASSSLPWYDAAADAGFCLIGTVGEKFARAILRLLLDSETPDG